MRGSIVIGRIKGIEIELNLSWFIIFGLVTFTLATSFFPENYPEWEAGTRWLLGGIMAIMLFASVLLHELSHSLVSKSLGINVKKISLFIFGGIAQIEKEPDEPMKELKIAIAGPLMSIAISALSIAVYVILSKIGASDKAMVPFIYIANVNLVLAIFNMVPAFPLDGGRVLRAILWKVKGDLSSATRIASAAGGVFGYMLIFIGVFWVLTGNVVSGIWFAFIGWFINQASQSSYQNMLMSDMFGKIKVKEFMSENVVTVNSYISIQDMVDKYLYKYKFSSFPVKRGEEVVGIVNIEKIKELDSSTWDQNSIEAVLGELDENLIVSPNDTVSTAMTKLFTNGVGRVLVMEHSKLVGIVSRTDILNHIRIYNQLH